MTSSYIDSILCVLLLLTNCGSKTALAFTLFLLKIITITITKITTLTIKAAARELMDIVHIELISVEISVFMLIELLKLLVMFPQATV